LKFLHMALNPLISRQLYKKSVLSRQIFYMWFLSKENFLEYYITFDGKKYKFQRKFTVHISVKVG